MDDAVFNVCVEEERRQKKWSGLQHQGLGHCRSPIEMASAAKFEPIRQNIL